MTVDESLALTSGSKIKIRHSGIDLLRIIAIILICFSHANLTFRDYFGISELDIYSKSVFVGFTPFGTIGNILFVICSSYFLVDKAKMRTEKVLNILLDSTLISICFLLGFLISGKQLDWDTIIRQLVPDLYALNWFIPCYIIFYILSPIVILGLKHLSKKVHFVLVVFSLVVYGCLSLVYLTPVGSYLLQFFYILNLMAFIKWHCPSFSNYKKINLFLAIFGIVLTYIGYIGSILIIKHSQNISFFGNFNFINMYSPLLVIALICLFNLFKGLKINSSFISYLGSCSLFVYVIHDNYLLRTITRVHYYEWAIASYGINYAVLFMLACGAFMSIVGFVAATIYKESLNRLTIKMAHIIYKWFKKALDWLYLKLCS